MPERAETPCPGRVASGSLDLSPFLSHMQKTQSIIYSKTWMV